LLALSALSGCASPIHDFMRAPDLSPVGSGIGEGSPDATIALPALGTFSFDWLFTPATSSAGGGNGTPGSWKHDFNSVSSSNGNGDINRSEQINLSVPAVVTGVLPNGNLVIKGSQEVRVNFELRQLTIAGIVRPSDISRDNTIAYDRIAEARIAYGGRGRITEAQQPGWGQQVYDFVKPY
jgi:flagellar L-ring protein precursor FlgH